VDSRVDDTIVYNDVNSDNKVSQPDERHTLTHMSTQRPLSCTPNLNHTLFPPPPSGMQISPRELFESTLQWNVLAYRYWKVRGLNTADPASVKTAIDLEKEFDTKYRCGKERDPKDGHCLGDEYFKNVEEKVRLCIPLLTVSLTTVLVAHAPRIGWWYWMRCVWRAAGH